MVWILLGGKLAFDENLSLIVCTWESFQLMSGTFAQGGMVYLISYEMESLEVYEDELRCLGFQTADAINQVWFGLKVTELLGNELAYWLFLTKSLFSSYF
jgi:hypothetical protein